MKQVLLILAIYLSSLALSTAHAAEELPAEAQAILAETNSKSQVKAIVTDIANIDGANVEDKAAPAGAGEAKSVAGETKAEAAKADKAAIEKLPENEIPLALESKKAAAGGDSMWMRMIFAIAVAGFLAAGAWILSRRMSKPGQRKSGPQIKILNQHYLGPKKSLAIIHVAGESILVGITDQNISLIKSLSLIDDEVPAEVPAQFANTLKNTAAITEGDDELEDFTMSGINQIKDVVGRRLRNMRTLG